MRRILLTVALALGLAVAPVLPAQPADAYGGWAGNRAVKLSWTGGCFTEFSPTAGRVSLPRWEGICAIAWWYYAQGGSTLYQRVEFTYNGNTQQNHVHGFNGTFYSGSF